MSNQNGRRSGSNQQQETNDDDWARMAAGIAGLAGLGLAIFGGIKMFSSASESDQSASSESDRRDGPEQQPKSRPQSPPRCVAQSYNAFNMFDQSREYTDREKRNPHSVLNDVKKIIALDEDDRLERVQLVEKVVKGDPFKKDGLIHAMKSVDKLFDVLYSELYHTGSYYDGLRCETADEFDINMILNIDEIKSMIFFDKNAAIGFLRVGLKTNSLCSEKPKWINIWSLFLKELTIKSDGRIYFSPYKMKQWIQSVIHKALNTFKFQNYMIRAKESGPAWTISIKRGANDKETDIDLVPAFRFGCEYLKGYGQVDQFAPYIRDPKFFVIPKSFERDPLTWRLDFHDFETHVIRKAPQSKDTIRLLKLFVKSKKGQFMEELSSYSLKTVVMHMIRTKNLEWEEKNLPNLFVKGLETLSAFLEHGKIPYLFHEGYDVSKTLKPDIKRYASRWIREVIENLEKYANTPKCRDVWMTYFDKKEKQQKVWDYYQY